MTDNVKTCRQGGEDELPQMKEEIKVTFRTGTKFEEFLRGFQRKNPGFTAKIPSRGDNKALLCGTGFSQAAVTPWRGSEQLRIKRGFSKTLIGDQ